LIEGPFIRHPFELRPTQTPILDSKQSFIPLFTQEDEIKGTGPFRGLSMFLKLFHPTWLSRRPSLPSLLIFITKLGRFSSYRTLPPLPYPTLPCLAWKKESEHEPVISPPANECFALPGSPKIPNSHPFCPPRIKGCL
jgi:hypothetical protein